MNQLMKRETGSVVNWEDGKMREFIKSKYAPGATDIEFEEFCQVAKMSDANPVLREVFFIKYQGSPGSIQFSIHWMIKKAEETGVFRGFTLPWYRDESGKWHEGVFPKDAPGQSPTHCKIGVIRSDHPEPVWGIVSWSERAKTQAEWRNQPLHMIAKCAKAEALRCSVPGLSRVYITDEMHRDESGTWSHDPERPLSERVKEVADSGREKRDLRKGIIDPSVEPIKPDVRDRIRRQCAGLGMTKAAEFMPYINAILDDHGLPEVKNTKELTVAAGEIIMNVLNSQKPEPPPDDPDLEPEEDKTGLFPEGENGDEQPT